MSEIEFNEGGDVPFIPIFGNAHAVDFHDEDVRDEFNDLLDDAIIADDVNHTGIVYTQVRDVLSFAGYNLPHVQEFGEMPPELETIYYLYRDDGDSPEYFYFGYSNDGEDVLAEIMTQEELEKFFGEDD